MFKKGIIIALVTAVLDQISKYLMLEVVDVDSAGTIEITSFFNLVMVWNRGVSFGMGNNFEHAQIIFLIVALILLGILIHWLKKIEYVVGMVSIGLVIGGAIGNVVDRVRFGAVVDFLDFHLYGYHWPAFNIADSAICVGAFMLAFFTIFLDKKPDENK